MEALAELSADRMKEVLVAILGTLRIINKHTVAFLRPQRGKEAQIIAQLTACMGGGEVAQVSCKGYIVLRIEDVESHLFRNFRQKYTKKRK